MNLSRRASYVTMVVGALIAWSDIDTDRIAATTFGLLLLAGGAVVAAIAHYFVWRSSADDDGAYGGDVLLLGETAVAAEA